VEKGLAETKLDLRSQAEFGSYCKTKAIAYKQLVHLSTFIRSFCTKKSKLTPKIFSTPKMENKEGM